VRIIPERYPEDYPMSSTNSDFTPFGIPSRKGHAAPMVEDPEQRRRALKKFIEDAELVVSTWEHDAKVGGGALRKFLAGVTKSMNDKTYRALAYAAGQKLKRPVLVSELLGSSAEPAYGNGVASDVRRIDPPIALPQGADMARDVPVFGTVSDGAGGLRMGVDQALDYVRRPPRFSERKGKPKDIFAVHVEGVAMRPKHFPGDLLYIDPLRGPQVGDSVLAEIKTDDGPHRVLLRRLAGRTETEIQLEQYDPPGTMAVLFANVVHLFRVMTTNDLLGF
jgi:phage repressor protein C with HTH and peptisase S24 domain